MTDFALTGKKGTGKSKNGVRIMVNRYLKQKRRVATNLDLYLEKLFGPYSRITYVRVPDKPSAFDLEAAGHGNPDDPLNEDRAGMLLLDELGTWLNSRTFGDKGRAGLLDYLAQARKFGWDCWYVMQNIVQVDKQLRESFVEYVTRHTRFDKVKWPFVGGLLSLLFGERAGYMPKFHVAVTRVGCNPQDLVADRVAFTGKDIQDGYNTLQTFREDYPHGTHSVLSPWHLKGRFMRQERAPFFTALLRALVGCAPAPVRRPAMTRPDPDWMRVRDLCSRLPAAQGAALMARYARVRLTAAGAAPARAGAAAAAGGR